MATNDDGTPDASDPLDLDRLIGELETEAAHRRAEPGFPHDADARLHFELARQAPSPPDDVPMHDVIAQIEELAAEAEAPPKPPSGRRRSRHSDGEAADAMLRRLQGLVRSTALAVAGALEALDGRLDRLEARVANFEADPGTAASPSPPDATDALGAWRGRLTEVLPPNGRVLYAQSRADEVVAELRSAGFDAYGITSTPPEHRPGPDVRAGGVLAHLGAVPDGALGAVVLTGVPEVMSPQAIGPLVSELARVATTVVVVSEAPWWWRQQRGPVDADLAPGRPLDPDTWLHAFHGAAMTGSAEYDPEGRTYRVVARSRG